jgi:outer membrane protein assembly factor BamB
MTLSDGRNEQASWIRLPILGVRETAIIIYKRKLRLRKEGVDVKTFTLTFALLMVLSCVLVSLPSINVANAAVSNSYAWATLQADAQRTGYTESPAPDNNQTFWKFQTGGPITSSPAVAAGLVFVASADGYLYAINATTGGKVWDFWIGQGINSPTIANGKVFITSTSGSVFALDMYTGSEVWRQSLGEEAGLGAPLIVGSRVFVSGNQTVFVFNEAFGVRLYDESIAPATGIRCLIYSNGLIVAVASRGGTAGVRGFEFKNGYGRFSLTLTPTGEDRVTSGLTLGYEFSVATTGLNDDCTAFALSEMGMIMWERHLNGVTEASPAFAYDTVYVSTSSYTYALNVGDGVTKWSRPIDGEYAVSSPAVADGKVYFGLDNGYVYALDAFTGDFVWSYKTDGPAQSSPAISDGLLLVGSNDGFLYAIGYPKLQVFDAGTWNDVSYQVSIQSNSLVTDFIFNQSLKQISFNITGQSGTAGFCNVTIPLNLLGGEYSVTAGESQPLAFEEQTNASHSFLYFNYPNDISHVRIEGTEVIPEFPSRTPMLFILALFGVAVPVYKQSLHKKREMQNVQVLNMK